LYTYNFSNQSSDLAVKKITKIMFGWELVKLTKVLESFPRQSGRDATSN